MTTSTLTPRKTDEGSCSSSSNSEVGESYTHSNLLRIQTKSDVFQKYEVLLEFGSGSMGKVSKVRIREDKIGGSAYHAKPRFGGFVGKLKQTLHIKDRTRTSAASHPTSPVPPQLVSSSSTSSTPVVQNLHHNLYALKSIILDRVSPDFVEELKNEIHILRGLDHPNIVKAHEVFFCRDKQIYIVLELCQGGDLYTRAPYTEKQVARIVTQLLSAVSYLHEHGVVHRDLKLENIMFEDSSDDADIKVIDFGLSKKFTGKPGYMTERVGTIYTMAPQVLQGIYSSQADLWAIGVIAYTLLSGTKPFNHKSKRGMMELIMSGKIYFDDPVWKSISDDAQDFVSKLIVVDPKVRLTGPDALLHTWIVKREQLPNQLPSSAELAALGGCLMNYRHTSQLKKLALTVIAHRSTSKEIMQLRRVFDSFDTVKNGYLSYDEFKDALKHLDYSPDVFDQIFSSVDQDHDGKIMYTEFLAATIEAQGYIAEDRIAEAFDRLDVNENGYISKDDLQEALGEDCDPHEIQTIIATADKNRDGKISYAEFLAVFRAQTSSKLLKLEGPIDPIC